MKLDSHIFRAYDIRGLADEQLTPEGAKLIGQAFGSILRELYSLEHPRVAVGRDARTHGPALQQAVVEGLMATGCHVLDIGPTPSPCNYFTVCTQELDGSIQVTASHNPKEYNGFKLQTREAHSYCGDDIQTLRERIDAGNFLDGEGEVEDFDALNPYINHLSTMFADAGQGLSVVIDAGNGIGGPAYTQVLQHIGCEVTELYTEPDGEFPNHPADPSKWDTLKELQEQVTKTESQLGLAFDGDGDRLGLVDGQGNICTADTILMLLAEDHLKRHPGKAVVFTVSSSGALETEISKWGGQPVMAIVGHAFVEHAMMDKGALLGGEQSGHFFCFEDYYHYDDAIAAGLWLIKLIKESGKSISELTASHPPVFQAPESRPGCPDGEKVRIVQAITDHFAKDYSVNTMDGVRIDFGDGAWAGVRKSNTSPCLSVCIEARSQEKLSEVEKLVMEHLSSYPEIEL